MIINIYLADWVEALRRNLAGSLADDIRSAECPTHWLASPATWTPTDVGSFSHVIESLERLKPFMGSHNTRHLLPATDGLFECSQNFQLEEPMGRQFIAISPQSSEKIAKGLNAADFDAIRPFYYKHCPADRCTGSTDDRYETCFRSVLLQWRDATVEAASRSWGLLGHAG
ncbi:hypothetical protein OAM01_02100 [bacterium]|nr:hypothetical protein [bacterium]